jgi:alkyl sulfatase BDS1-like metallo-beta-lactamase superfamily hydrolase
LLPHDVPVGCDAAMLALKNAFHHQAAHDVRIDAEVRFATDTFRITVDDGAIDIARGPARHPDLVMHTDSQTLEELVFAGSSVRAAERSGTLKLGGDRTQLEQLLRLFGRPGGVTR